MTMTCTEINTIMQAHKYWSNNNHVFTNLYLMELKKKGLDSGLKMSSTLQKDHAWGKRATSWYMCETVKCQSYKCLTSNRYKKCGKVKWILKINTEIKVTYDIKQSHE